MRQERDGDPSAPTAVEALRQELRRIKEKEGLTLDSLARHTGWSRSSWRRFLLGEGVAFPDRQMTQTLGRKYAKPDTERLLGLWDAAQAEKLASTATATAPPSSAAPADTTEPGDDKPLAAAPAVGTTAQPVEEEQAEVPSAAAAAPVLPPERTEPPKAPHQESGAASAALAGKGKSRNSARVYVVAAVTAALVFGGAAGLIATTADSGDKEAKNPGQTTSAEPPAAPEAEPPTGKNNATSSGRPSTAPKGAPSASVSRSAGAAASPAQPSGTTPASTTGTAGAANCKFNWDRTQTMARGMVGSKVSQIQCLLNYNYGQSLTVDEKFGAGTEAAVKTVQACSGIKVDGQVGPDTWAYLDHPKPTCGH